MKYIIIFAHINDFDSSCACEVSRDTKTELDDLDSRETRASFQLGRQTRASRETPAVAATRDGMCSPTKRKREKGRGRKITHETRRKKETESV